MSWLILMFLKEKWSVNEGGKSYVYSTMFICPMCADKESQTPARLRREGTRRYQYSTKAFVLSLLILAPARHSLTLQPIKFNLEVFIFN